MAVKTYNELFSNLNKVLEKNIDKLANESKFIIDKFLKRYYEEYVPDIANPNSYRRTYQFLNSCVRSDVQSYRGQYVTYVYIDYQSMLYYIKSLDTYFESGDEYNYDIVAAANEGYHGVDREISVSEMHFWDDSLNEIYYSKVLISFVNWLKRDTKCKVELVNGWVSI